MHEGDRAAASPAGRPRVPGFEILEEVGRGGLGVVYRARQEPLGREVALKMIVAGVHASDEVREQFRREAASVAQLQHPHIVQLFEFGEFDGLPYFALEFVNGGTLARALAAGRMPLARTTELFEQLARAVHHAHAAGLIHRDLKPANILLTGDGTPKITDFGLAKRLDQCWKTRRPARSWAPPATWPPSRRRADPARSARPRTCTLWERSSTSA